MFGVLAAGRAVETAAEQVGPTQWAFALPEAARINHIAVFLTSPLPPGTGVSVHCATDAQIASAAPWRRLGYICNEKPSAIFRLGGAPASASAGALRLGLSVEPIADVLAAPAATGVAPLAASAPVPAVEQAAESAFNFVASFARPAGQFPAGESVVPLSTVQQWHANATRRAHATGSL